MTDAQKIALISEVMASDEERIANIQDDRIAHFSDATQAALRDERGALEGKVAKAKAQLAHLKGDPPAPAKKKRTRKKAG